MSFSSIPAMLKAQNMIVRTPPETKGTAFQQLCIHGSWTEVLQFLTEWRKARAAEPEGTLFNYTEAYQPYDGFEAAFRNGRLDIVKGLMEEGLSLTTGAGWNFISAAAGGAATTRSSEMLEFMLGHGWDPNHHDFPSSDGTSYRDPQVLNDIVSNIGFCH
jgi:hypothetical protein